MCGICGIFSFDSSAGHPDNSRALQRMSELMARRGPDDAGTWADPAGHLQLGFRRLAILDLSPTGHQPMLADEGRFALVCNGEVYNFRELRRALEQEGVRFSSTGDAEVVLHALARWGPEALEDFNGMFALAFYDARERRLLLARDHAGIKPLYYAHTPRGILFASQYDQILSHPWSESLSTSPEGLSLYLRLGYIPAPYALLEGTAMLEPGTWIEISATGQVRRGRYFTFLPYREPDLRGMEAYEAVDAAIGEAVLRQMVSDVPLGTFLSGGIDSPLVAAKSQAAGNGPVRAFTLGMPGDPEDESEDAAFYAQQLGLNQHVELVTPDHVLSKLDCAIAASSEPLATHGIFPTIIISEAARREVKVMLSGDGGDELFWGYAKRFISGIRKTSGLLRPPWLRGARRGIKKILHAADPYDDPPRTTIGAWYRTRHSHIPERWLRRIFPTLPAWPGDFDLFDYAGTDPDQTAQWLRWNEFVGHLTMVLLKVDRASMHHALEVRVPLLDRQVVEVASRVDWRSCLDLDHRLGKLPLRHALAHHAASQSRSKRGFGIPINEWLRAQLRPLFESVVLPRRELIGLPVDREAMQEFFRRHLAGADDFGAGLWLLLSTSLWEDRHARARRGTSLASSFRTGEAVL